MINQNQSIVIASFRKDLLSELQSKFGIFGAPVFDLGHQPISKIAIGINTFVHKNIALANDFKK